MINLKPVGKFFSEHFRDILSVLPSVVPFFFSDDNQDDSLREENRRLQKELERLSRHLDNIQSSLRRMYLVTIIFASSTFILLIVLIVLLLKK